MSQGPVSISEEYPLVRGVLLDHQPEVFQADKTGVCRQFEDTVEPWQLWERDLHSKQKSVVSSPQYLEKLLFFFLLSSCVRW